jgi:hypothetical protein
MMLGNFDELVERQSLDRRAWRPAHPHDAWHFSCSGRNELDENRKFCWLKADWPIVSASAVAVADCLAEVCLPEARFVD